MPNDIGDCFLLTYPAVKSYALQYHQDQICRVVVGGSEIGNVVYLASVLEIEGITLT